MLPARMSPPLTAPIILLGHDGRNNGFFDFDTLEAAYDPLNKPSDSKFLKERMIIYDIKKQ